MELWPNRFDIIFSHGLDPWFRHPPVVRSPSWCVGPAGSALDFLASAGAIYFSAFFSLLFQIRGLIGPGGILPAGAYLRTVAQSLGNLERLWYAPTLFWWSSGNTMLMAVCWVGMVASLLLVLNLWPRGMLLICFICFLSFVSAAQDFSGYQSDDMLLEAGFIALFFAPPGLRPGLARAHPPSRASLFLLRGNGSAFISNPAWPSS